MKICKNCNVQMKEIKFDELPKEAQIGFKSLHDNKTNYHECKKCGEIVMASGWIPF